RHAARAGPRSSRRWARAVGDVAAPGALARARPRGVDMSLVSFVISILALAWAALLAAADGALLSVSDMTTNGAVVEAPTGGTRDFTHRALSIARIIALLVAGVAAARAFELDALVPGAAIGLGIVIAILAVLVGEVMPRAAGEAVGARALAALTPVVHSTEVLMRPLVAGGAILDRILRRVLPPFTPAQGDREITAEQFRRIVTPQQPAPHVLVQRHRGARGDGAARRHPRPRARHAVVRGARSGAQLAARAAAGVRRDHRPHHWHPVRQGSA